MTEFGQALRSTAFMLLTALATLAALELVLRVADLRVLREGTSERSLTYRYDPELGWAPVPNSNSVVTTARTIHAQKNSLGFRDMEFQRDGRPRMLFIGDSFVWGRIPKLVRASPTSCEAALPAIRSSMPASPVTAPIRNICCCSGSGP